MNVDFVKKIFVVLLGVFVLNGSCLFAEDQNVKEAVESFRDFLTLLDRNIVEDNSSEQQAVSAFQGARAWHSLEKIEKELAIKPRNIFWGDLRDVFLDLCNSVKGVEKLQPRHLRLVLRHINAIDNMLNVEGRDMLGVDTATVIEAMQDFKESIVYLLTQQKINVGNFVDKLKDWVVIRPMEFTGDKKIIVSAVASGILLGTVGGSVLYKLKVKNRDIKNKNDDFKDDEKSGSDTGNDVVEKPKKREHRMVRELKKYFYSATGEDLGPRACRGRRK